MKGGKILMQDKIYLLKRAVIVSVNYELKNICQIEHIRHRSFTNFITNLIACLLALSNLPKKPTIHIERLDSFSFLNFNPYVEFTLIYINYCIFFCLYMTANYPIPFIYRIFK